MRTVLQVERVVRQQIDFVVSGGQHLAESGQHHVKHPSASLVQRRTVEVKDVGYLQGAQRRVISAGEGGNQKYEPVDGVAVHPQGPDFVFPFSQNHETSLRVPQRYHETVLESECLRQRQRCRVGAINQREEKDIG